jgi:hypothetical protein
MSGKIGENFGEYIRELMSSEDNLNSFVSTLARERGDASEELVRAVRDGGGEFGPYGITYSEQIDSYREAKNNRRFSDEPLESLRPDETYDNSEVEKPAIVSMVQN